MSEVYHPATHGADREACAAPARAATMTGVKRKLAASFVVISVMPGCKKMSGATDPEPPRERSASIFRADNGNCELMVPISCPKNATCNPPAPEIIDCPPSHRDAGDPPSITRRPKGKEDWIRVRSHLYVGTTCQYVAERFCAPPPKAHECTSQPDYVTVPCAGIVDDGGVEAGEAGARAPAKYRVEPFVYKDGVGACHRVGALTCTTGDCPLPEGDPAPCP
jgi:hypothetical protein